MTSPPPTAIVCDSTTYLPPELIARHGFHEVSLYVTLNGVQRRESDIDDYESFFEQLRSSDEMATTSQPSVGDFISAYEPLLAAGGEIVSLHLSSAISGTVQSATQARQQLIDQAAGGERIYVHDSRSACGGMGMMALAGARVAKRGGDGAAVVNAFEAAREKLRMWFAVDTLEYLRKGGRIGAARAWVGSALQIKPILTLEEEITPVERVRTRRRAFDRMVDYARELKEAGNDAWVIQHIHDRENAEQLAARVREILGSDPIFISEVGPVIGAHTGPGLLGIGGLPQALLDP